MRQPTLPEKPALAASLLLALSACAVAFASGCASNHHVSPWGERPGPTLAPFLQRPDLAAQLADVDREAAALGLTLTSETPFELPPKGSGHQAALRAYSGKDAAGRPTSAVRVATARGVVLALGPLDVGDADRSRATELVPALAQGDAGVAFASGSDINGDGVADVIVKNGAGAIEIWHVGETGSGPYAITMAVPPARGATVEGSNVVALHGRAPIAPDDPIAPELDDVATFEQGAYSNGTTAARAWHSQRAAKPLPTRVSDASRARAAIEHAWHAILAGEPADRVRTDLASERVPRALRASFESHSRTIAALPHVVGSLPSTR
jgi:hypothetical protein